MSHDLVNARRDRHSRLFERIEVVTRKPAGEKFARLSNSLSHEQKLYHGLVKPREADHDAQIYRAYRKGWARVETEGGSNPRVLLDGPVSVLLPGQHGRLSRLATDGQIQLPDNRIEYELGPRIAHRVLRHRDGDSRLPCWSPWAKAQAGFDSSFSGYDALRS
jgi:hypothetical protein